MLALHSPAPDIEPAHYQDFSPYQFNFDNSYPQSPHSQPRTPQRRQLMSTQLQRSQNPSIRVQNSLPFFGEEQGAQQQMLAQTPYMNSQWGSNENLLNPSSIAHTTLPRRFNEGYHNRASSASSSASIGPPSPKGNTTAFPHIAGLDVAGFSPSTFDSSDLFATTRSNMPKSLPTPAGTPTQKNFSQDYQHLSSPHDAASQGAMKRVFQDNRAAHDDDSQSYAFSGPQSVSSVSHHNSPVTPQTVYEGDYDDAVKNLHQHAGFNPQLNSSQLPSGNLDDFYITQMQHLPPQQQQAIARTGGLSPFKTSLANRFQAAQMDHVASRTSSPANSISREKSPFRQDAPLNSTPPMPGQRLGPPQMTAAQYSQNMGNAVMYGQQQQQRPQQIPAEQPKTVSPKDVELEYHDEDQISLFPSSQASQFSLPREESNVSTSSAFGQPGSYYTNIPQMPQQGQQYGGFVGHQRRQQSAIRSSGDQQLPDFPASLTSMETTASSSSEPEQQSSQSVPTTIPRPSNTSSDLGAYTCTHQGCTQRFNSPVKMQKHQREIHQPAPPDTANLAASPPSSNHGHVSSAATIATRNSQSGPHKCGRINPTTGKPCNSIFSRPYDLTRHEDTIHNVRKQKVRCHLCTEEKMFSRNDALTRHMRVVHPEVDWPGKVKRRGRD